MRRLRLPKPATPGVAAGAAWRKTLRGDTLAGLAVATYLVPQCMAYARLAGLEPVTGLWTALELRYVIRESAAVVAYLFR